MIEWKKVNPENYNKLYHPAAFKDSSERPPSGSLIVWDDDFELYALFRLKYSSYGDFQDLISKKALELRFIGWFLGNKHDWVEKS